MRIYRPDGWVILKFTPENEESFYRIFGTWRGGFVNGDTWRLSSGSIEPPTLSECGLFWVWAQDSGSTYELAINEEDGCTLFTKSALANIVEKSSEFGALVERIKLDSIL
jgi:hypothetical protein